MPHRVTLAGVDPEGCRRASLGWVAWPQGWAGRQAATGWRAAGREPLGSLGPGAVVVREAKGAPRREGAGPPPRVSPRTAGRWVQAATGEGRRRWGRESSRRATAVAVLSGGHACLPFYVLTSERCDLHRSLAVRPLRHRPTHRTRRRKGERWRWRDGSGGALPVSGSGSPHRRRSRRRGRRSCGRRCQRCRCSCWGSQGPTGHDAWPQAGPASCHCS